MDGSEYLGLQTITTEWGEVLLRQKQVFYDQYPAIDLAAFLRLNADDFCRIGKSKQLQSLQPQNLLLLDTETTGLAGGTGTYVFLVGTARFQSDHLLIKQYYLRHQGLEYALLQMVLREFDGIEGIISFNGKSYDLPLLKTRLVLNRLHFPYDDLPHLDLLHSSRRLWKSLPGYSLKALEEQLLNFRREGDIPGFMIPNLYFRTLLTGDIRPIEPVLQHNVIDLISMVGLAAAAARLFHKDSKKPMSSLIGIMRTLAALDRLQEATDLSIPSESAAHARAEWAHLLLYRARCFKRLCRTEEAAQIWRQYITAGMPFSFEPYIELAKYYEHGCRDPRQALFFIEKAESRLQIMTELRASELQHHTFIQDFSRRKVRLLRKINNP